MGNSFYSYEELKMLNFAKLGEDVRISRKASLYGSEEMKIGDHVRIDDFCLLSGPVVIGNYVHIAAYSCLYAGEAGIVLEDYTCLSSRCAVYALSDDYSGNAMTNATVPVQYRNVINGRVVVGRHVVVGTGSTILPGVTLGEGSSIGAMTLVNRNIEPFSICVGIPARKLAERSRKLLELETKLLEDNCYEMD